MSLYYFGGSCQAIFVHKRQTSLCSANFTKIALKNSPYSALCVAKWTYLAPQQRAPLSLLPVSSADFASSIGRCPNKCFSFMCV
jgi:hypothetical protein